MPPKTAPPPLSVLPRGGAAWALAGYVGVVTLLVGVSYLTQDSAGPALYLVAAGLTLPTGLAIYPALWLNALAAGAVHELLGWSWNSVGALQKAGVVVVFAVVAFLNGSLVSYAWRSIRLDMRARSIRRATLSPPANR